MDDISTPGSFWLNMAQPKNENGDRVNAFDVVEYYIKFSFGLLNSGKNDFLPQAQGFYLVKND